MKALLFLLFCAAAQAAPPALVVPDGQLGLTGCRAGPQVGRQLVAPAEGMLLESSFEQSAWSGRLERRALAVAAGGAIEVGAEPLWEAGALLDDIPAQDRKIYTLVRKGQSTITVPFKWDSLPPAERALIGNAQSGEARLAYLRGERSDEGGALRRRGGVLGDAIHSIPLLVGAPSISVQGASYDSFHARFKSRAAAVYLGANDGMLHAFAASDGAELFAYVPNALLPFLKQLGEPAYRHRPYADGSAGQGEALVGGQWRSVLVSGMGMGARGVFALDITDPAAFGAGMGALWEFTDNDDPVIGYVSASPQVIKLKVGMTRGVPDYRYFALVASGVNNYAPDSGHADAGGALFLLALDKPASARWKEGVNYYRLAAPAAEPGQANALAPPALVTAGDGSVRYAYAGDLQGRLWRFDFSGKPPYSSRPVFTARDDGGRRQPITQAPRVVFAPGGGYVILFGTGKLIEEADLRPAAFATQSFYAVRDTTASEVAGRGELAKRTMSGGANYTIKGEEFVYNGAGARKGWYFDFPNARADGERLAASPVLASGAVFVATVLPGSNACHAATRTYVLDALSGLALGAGGAATSTAATGEAALGILPVVFELGASTAMRGATGGAGATRKLGVLHLPGDGGAPAMQEVEVRLPARRISWREVANWRELHDAAKK